MYDYYGIDRKSELVNGLLFDNKTKIYLQMKLEVMQEEMHLFPYWQLIKTISIKKGLYCQNLKVIKISP